jgi:1-acyl-sn-glycerol-3-phosphate acyltransferase
VAIFPEGNVPHYRDRHVLGMFYPGVVRMALRYRVPIVPAAMVGFDRANPILKVIPHDKSPDDLICLPFTLPFKCIVEFGKPLYLDEYYDKKLSKEEEFWIANEVVRPRLHEVLDRYHGTAMAPVTAVMKKPV